MDGWLFAAALLSAALHAGWNAAVKVHADPRAAMAAQMHLAALSCIPGLAFAGLPPPAAWPWLLLSSALNTALVLALLRAYALGDFGTVYPIARATAVLGVTAAAPLLLGDRLGGWALVGVAAIVAALALLAIDAWRGPAHARFGPHALAWTLAAGLLIAGCVLADAQGVRASGSALSYGFAVSITNAIGIAAVSRGAGSPLAAVRSAWRTGLPAAAAAMLSYLLILYVYRHAPVPLGSALRDTSAVFAMLIAVLWLKERLSARRVAVLALAVAGVPLLRLG
ncbi:MAG: EamA family transporter [Rubrivivax sp.]|nr:EamA family transporter [Rubrivivax sp.]